jgi:leucyl aminopeptidase (aminopeptidase T)
MSDLQRAVEAVVGECLAIAGGEQVLVVADGGTRPLGEALRDTAARRGAEAVLAVMDPRVVDGEEPPPAIAAALKAADVFIAPTSRSLSHTRARKGATDAGARGATLPGVTEDMLARLMSADFDTLKPRSRRLADLLSQADEAHFTCPRGSDLRLDLRGRSGIADDGDLAAPAAFGNLPCGEGFVAPLGGEGRLVASTLAGIGRTAAGEPAVLTVSDGRLTAATQPEGEQLLDTLRAAGEQGTNLAELGIGTNEHATLTGNVLEDEKILGTVHVAFGASAGIGGTVAVPVHLDCVVLEPTLTIGGTPVLEAGRLAPGL